MAVPENDLDVTGSARAGSIDAEYPLRREPAVKLPGPASSPSRSPEKLLLFDSAVTEEKRASGGYPDEGRPWFVDAALCVCFWRGALLPVAGFPSGGLLAIA